MQRVGAAIQRLLGLVVGAGSSNATGDVSVTLSSVTALRQQVGVRPPWLPRAAGLAAVASDRLSPAAC